MRRAAVLLKRCGMDADGKEFVAGLLECFVELRAPRVQGRCDHLLIDILAITLLGALCGAEDWPDVEEFGLRRQSWLTIIKWTGFCSSRRWIELSRLRKVNSSLWA
jgi:hypothetical protein